MPSFNQDTKRESLIIAEVYIVAEFKCIGTECQCYLTLPNLYLLTVYM